MNSVESPLFWDMERKMSELMSQEEYVRDLGLLCPKCKGVDCLDCPQGVDPEINGSSGYAEVKCAECGFKYYDLWKLVGFEEMEE